MSFEKWGYDPVLVGWRGTKLAESIFKVQDLEEQVKNLKDKLKPFEDGLMLHSDIRVSFLMKRVKKLENALEDISMLCLKSKRSIDDYGDIVRAALKLQSEETE